MLELRVVKRDDPWRWGAAAVLPCALALSLGVSMILLAGYGKDPARGMSVLFEGSFGASWALADALLKSVPIFLCSLGVALAFRMQVWNIGAEGQFALGTIGATWMALSFPQAPAWVLLPLMFAASALFGGIWALVPAALKLRLKVNEIISTLMLNYVAILLLDYLIYGAWKDPLSFGFPVSPEFTAGAVIPPIGDSRQHWGLAFCLVAGVAFWAFQRFTRTGYEIAAAGESTRVAAYARLPYPFLVLLVMGLSGAFAGWAGFIETSAVVGRLQPSIMAGYGYTAIVVAWLARLKPLPIALASFFLAALRVGVENLQLELEVPAAFGAIMEGLILLSVLAGQFFQDYRIRKRPS